MLAFEGGGSAEAGSSKGEGAMEEMGCSCRCLGECCWVVGLEVGLEVWTCGWMDG